MSESNKYMAAAHIFVSGRVQGVFYRANTVDIAREHNLTGWVRNLEDGRVEAILEGEKEDVQKVIEWCRSGPPHASVTELEIEWLEYSGDLSGFTLKY